ncbi:MAG: ribose 5-phosphate isomerase B [Bacilli bacterium]|nr:ribose 5-phosphate isomerase B [Bacilli bacterium]MDD4076480.1 ribose 5-phosphate isomerase B [Bacilli bacterium]MDD4387769.1 ribose 5-phosphate isomerase B [Bacilli bacterium]
MKISIASDHGGFILKSEVIKYFRDRGYDMIDHGCPSVQSVDYPVYGRLVCTDVVNKKVDYGILICKTGIGMSIYANKHAGIRAGLVSNIETAHSARAHNDCNIICLAANFINLKDACLFIETFINTDFAGGRHKRRIDMIIERERKL